MSNEGAPQPRSHYDVLGVSPDADAKSIKKAFRKNAFNTHPDRNPDLLDAEGKFKRIQEAYDVLTDPRRKTVYDASLHAPRPSSPPPRPPSRESKDPVWDFFRQNSSGFGSMFDDMFQTDAERAVRRKAQEEKEERERQKKERDRQEAERQAPLQATIEDAKKIFNKQNFFGAESIEGALGIHLDEADIPPIPFSIAELKRASDHFDLNSRLVLRIEKDKNGEPITLKRLKEIMDQSQRPGKAPRMEYNDKYDQNETFYTSETPRTGWALVSNELIPTTLQAHYLEQTKLLIPYLREEVYKGEPLPTLYEEAISEFEALRGELNGFLVPGSDKEEFTKRLVNLQINQLLRRTPVEVIYDALLMTNDVPKDNFGFGVQPPGGTEWTIGIMNAEGWPVRMGCFAEGRNRFASSQDLPNNSAFYVGVYLSRRGGRYSGKSHQHSRSSHKNLVITES